MIKIEVQLNSSAELVHYLSKGHAHTLNTSDTHEFVKSSNSFLRDDGIKVCSALSALEYQFLYSAKMMCDSVLKNPIIKDGYFEFLGKLSEQNSDQLKKYIILSESLMIGVEMLKQNYPKLINVKILR